MLPPLRTTARKVPDNPDTTQLPKTYPPPWDWSTIERVLLVRVRSIGDAVLTTPSLTALRRFLPEARIDILLEDWVAPVLDGFPDVDNVISLYPEHITSRLKTAHVLRKTRYDLLYNLHGGATSALMTYLSGARYRVGFGHYRNHRLYTHLAIPAVEFWGRSDLQSAEQQLALLGWTGVPVGDRPRSSLTVTAEAERKIAEKLAAAGIGKTQSFALFHPAAAFAAKEWAAEKFASVAEYLSGKGITPIAVAAPNEEPVLSRLREISKTPIVTFSDFTLPEITALVARAEIFVGNDSGIAHIAGAVNTPCIVIFGPSHIDHWRPYTLAPNEVVSADGGIENVSVESVIGAIEKVIDQERA
jgi:heptosyltransferase-3